MKYVGNSRLCWLMLGLFLCVMMGCEETGTVAAKPEGAPESSPPPVKGAIPRGPAQLKALQEEVKKK